jgi:poly-gamma-glutamate synthesis protein (capsule biosynthesis protein)
MTAPTGRRTVLASLASGTAALALAACGPGHAFLAGGAGPVYPLDPSPTGAPVLRPSALAALSTPTPSPASDPTGEPSGPTSSDAPSTKATRVSVALTGDVLIHNGVWQTAERDAARRGETLPDFRPMFAGIKPRIESADLAICHLETPLSRPRGPYLNYPIFSAPPTVLDGLIAAGYDGCTTASNHSVDRGFTGLVRTIRAMDDRDLPHTGTNARPRDALRPLVFTVHGVEIGLISMTFGTNGLPVSKPWSVNLIDVPRAIAQARTMHRAGVDVVMVAVHAGDEYSHVPSAQQVAVFHALARSPYVDLVYGHHSHVVEPVRRVEGTWVVYGLGNLVAEQETAIPDTYRGVIAQVVFVQRPDGTYRAERPTYTPTVITDPQSHGATRVLDATALLGRPGEPSWLRRLARASIESVRTIQAVD